MPQSKKIFIFIICIVTPLVVGFLGSYFTMPAITSWYQTLNRPPITPPNWVFGPVWTTLYVLMGLSSYIVFKNGISKKNKKALDIYIAQLVFNFLWSFVFFGNESLFGGLLIIIILWILIFMSIKRFSKISKQASYLLYPYLVWVSFATILNLSFLLLN